VLDLSGELWIGQIVGRADAALARSITVFPEPAGLSQCFKEVGGQGQEGLVDIVSRRGTLPGADHSTSSDLLDRRYDFPN